MPLTITGGSTNILIDRVEYDAATNSFLCYENGGTDPVFSQDLPFILEEMPSQAYTEKIYFFKNTFYPSGKILTIEIDERLGSSKTAGVIFTLDDLLNLPEIFDNIHVKKVAFNVLKKLLEEKTLSIDSKPVPYRSDSAYNLFDFYDEDAILIIICDQFVTFNNYNFFNYLTTLYKSGFRYSPFAGFDPAPIESGIVQGNFSALQKRLRLFASKNELSSNYFIKELLTNFIYYSKDNEVGRFHLFYQVVEMLMEKIFKREVKEKMNKDFENASGYDTKDFFREVMRDSYVLDKLIGNTYSAIHPQIKEELSYNIEQFLTYTLTGIPDNFSGKLYKVRNTLFHGYSKILENDTLNKSITNSRLKKLNDSFELLIMELIFTYSS
ncbi:MAG TPA: hypothetical protein VJ844_04910 [Mucilaginibacter sp.]|nr:hypothetical protein [Mucilaginibacter sp.]